MSQKGIEQLIGKALADNDFVEDFLRDPDGKVQEAGLDIIPEELAQIKQIDKTKAKKFVESFETEFGTRKQQI